MSLGDIINGINMVTQTVGAVNGAVNTLAPALQNTEMALNNVANTFNPYRGADQYQYQQPYYPQQQQTTQTQQVSTLSSSDSGSPLATIGNGLTGAALGVFKGAKLVNKLNLNQPQQTPVQSTPAITESISSQLSPKTVGLSSLKAAGLSAGIGAVAGGLISGIDNAMKLSKNEITGSEATGNIVADTTVGFFSGLGGFGAGFGAATLASKVFKVGGGSIPVMIAAGVAGLAAGAGIDALMRNTGIRDSIAQGVRGMVE